MVGPIVIVGGGPAGLTTALALAELRPALASRVVVLERAHYPREKICAGAVSGRALRILRSLEALPKVAHVDIVGLEATTRLGRTRTTFPAPSGWVVRRAEFDAALAEQVRARGVTIIEGAKVTRLHRSSDGVSVEAGDEVMDASVLIGADGRESFVRRWLGIAESRWIAQAAEQDTTRGSDDTPGHLHFDLLAAELVGYRWHFPTPIGGGVACSRGVYDLGPRARDVGVRLAELALPRTAIGRARRYSERGWDPACEGSAPSVLLVGEARGIDATLGEGIGQSIENGVLAARYLIDRLDPGELHFRDYDRWLGRTHLGRDLEVRSFGARLGYVEGRRWLEPWVHSRVAGRVGLAYFGGEPFSWTNALFGRRSRDRARA